MIPGQIIFAEEDIEFNKELPVTWVAVKNTGDRPVQIGSHYHFAEVNPKLHFERTKAYGKRLNIAAGTSVRFEPTGGEEQVALVPIGGERVVYGLRGQVGGPLDGPGEDR
ncbi:urease subunit beta [Actinopolyspora biskrensis]|uniref:Urease subunit beta n=1 Tax=Actinopolyspora biskrensis TaxID=1470178 RepID=A0A852Z4N9_9ACTN|nr:urease subunit beta [Actinopolyspora biskrensis]NYH77327.1 urease subunit beta [Actinopolyspora biskrensis]